MVLKGIISVSHSSAPVVPTMSVPLLDQTSRRKHSHGTLEFCTLQLSWSPSLSSLWPGVDVWLIQNFLQKSTDKVLKLLSSKCKPSVMTQICFQSTQFSLGLCIKWGLFWITSYTLIPLPAPSISQVFSCLFHVIPLHWIIYCVNLPIHLSVAHPRYRKPRVTHTFSVNRSK